MLRNAGVQRLLLVAACAVLGGYEAWMVFVRETPAVTIQGQHTRTANEFGEGAKVSQTFEMMGNGLTAIEVQFATDQMATLLVSCELARFDASRPDEPITEHMWSVPIKRISGVRWQRLTFPALEDSKNRAYMLRLHLDGVIE